MLAFFFSSRRRHTRCSRDWSSDVCSSDLESEGGAGRRDEGVERVPLQITERGLYLTIDPAGGERTAILRDERPERLVPQPARLREASPRRQDVQVLRLRECKPGREIDGQRLPLLDEPHLDGRQRDLVGRAAGRLALSRKSRGDGGKEQQHGAGRAHGVAPVRGASTT